MNSQDDKQLRLGPTKQSDLHVLSVKEVVRFLHELSLLLENPRTGNPALGEALAQLVKVLERHSDQKFPEFLGSFTVALRSKRERKKNFSSTLVGLDLASLDLDRVRDLISRQQCTKEDLVRLGTQRFGIPKWGLTRQNKAAVQEAIEAALGNEESLAIISREASRHGYNRST